MSLATRAKVRTAKLAHVCLGQLQTSALSRCPALRQFIKNRRSAGEWTRGAGVTPD